MTGVSGAVVLESQAETDAVAASESERSSVPTVPEPETWALLALVAALLLATPAIATAAGRRGTS